MPTFFPVVTRDSKNNIDDITLTRNGRTTHMLGPAGASREESVALPFLQNLANGSLPVLLGAGAGYALQLIASHCKKNNLPLLVIDKEEEILQASELQVAYPHIDWITTTDCTAALSALTNWQNKHGNKPLSACTLPFYLRIDKDFYAPLRDACVVSAQFNFWEKIKYPRFVNTKPRILLLMSKYFLTGEIISACKRLDIPYHLIQVDDKGQGANSFIESLLEAALSFKPDFIFTINHLGVDREGVLSELLEKLQIPLASWFVDNPMLILAMYKKLVSPWTSIFTWDVDNIAALKALGFEHVHYLSLGTDAKRFALPAKDFTPPTTWHADVSFVGNSMVLKVAERLRKTALPLMLKERLTTTARLFAESEERSIASFLQATDAEQYTAYCAIQTAEDTLGYEAALTWEATRQYRYSCVQAMFPFKPLIVGDPGWDTLIPKDISWRKLSELNYYSDLPSFYPYSTINFNCTSKQMKGAVNQRVFDVPATGSFLLTDYREQVENLFEPQKEIICYHSPEEAKDLIQYYLKKPQERKIVVAAARKRILQEHTYDHRVLELIRTMQKIYG